MLGSDLPRHGSRVKVLHGGMDLLRLRSQMNCEKVWDVPLLNVLREGEEAGEVYRDFFVIIRSDCAMAHRRACLVGH